MLNEQRTSLIESFLHTMARHCGLSDPDAETLRLYGVALEEIHEQHDLLAAFERTFKEHAYGNRLPLAADVLEHHNQLREEFRVKTEVNTLPFTKPEAAGIIKEIKLSATPRGMAVHCELCRDGGFVRVAYALKVARPRLGREKGLDAWALENWPDRDTTKPVDYSSVFLMEPMPGPQYVAFTVRCNCRAAQMIGAGYESIDKYLVPQVVTKGGSE